jgi:pimeloyl-CoA dehydrogenase
VNLDLTEDQRAFQQEVRAFIAERLPPELRRKLREGLLANRDEMVGWHRMLNEKGWAAPHWPRRYGGAGLGMVEKVLLQEDLYQAPAPQPLAFNVTMLGPVLIRFGTPAQLSYWMPKLANLDVWFCQGFSEPGAGSDLASLRTAAIRDGDHYVVNGQKIWTTSAHWADWIFCLVRTSSEARRQDGISMLLFDLKSPGVTIRPIRSIDGRHHFNEVFLDNVHVPVANLVGDEGRGWDCTKFLLGNERTLIAKVGACKERLSRGRELLAGSGLAAAGRRRVDDEVALLDAEVRALEMIQWRMLALESSDSHAATLASVLKLKGSELQQRIATLLLRIEGATAVASAATENGSAMPTAGANYLYMRAVTIYGGSSEIQKELLARGMF